MLPIVLLVVLASLLEFSCANHVQPGRFVVNTQRSHGLVSRQHIQGTLLNQTIPAAATGIIPLQLASDRSSYYATISIGTMLFRVALDTASADLFLVSSACKTASCRSVPYPLSYSSPTFVEVNGNTTSFNLSFVDGTVVSGYVARESVTVANLTSSSQVFGVVTYSNITFVDSISGVLGLGFSRLSQIYQTVANATPFFASLTQQGLVNYPLFGIYLTRNETGTISLGAIDAAVVPNISSIEWHYVVPFAPIGSTNNVSSYLFWVLELSLISVNGSSFSPQPTYPNATANSSLAVLDIGTPGLYGPYKDVSQIFANMPGSRLVDSGGQWVVPCNTAETMSFSFGGRNFTLQPTDYMIGPADGDPTLCLTWPRATAPSADGIDWQLGSTFLRTVYTVFSYGINTKEPPIIGLYSLHNDTTPENYGVVSAFFASESATVATTLPNYLLNPPSYTTPPYTFNTSVTAPPGEIVLSELATSTYPAIFGQGLDAISVPLVSMQPQITTLVVTNSGGQVLTQTSVVATSTLPLGVPYAGWTAAGHQLGVPTVSILFVLSISFIFLSFT